jgi:hypothetical protein
MRNQAAEAHAKDEPWALLSSETCLMVADTHAGAR